MKRIGIFGGSFNPIHIGHLIVAQDAIEEAKLDTLFIVPCHAHTLKDPSEYVQDCHRLEMAGICTMDNQFMQVSGVEIERGETSYTIETARSFQMAYPRDEIHIVAGSDAFCDILKWKDYESLLIDFRWILVWREGHEARFRSLMERAAAILSPEAMKKLHLVRVIRIHDIRISSTDIRQRIKAGRSVKYLVSPAVEEYIYRFKLYR